MTSGQQSILDEISGWYSEQDHPQFFGKFTREQQEEMLEDDLLAGHNVPRLLFSVIAGGLVLAVVSLLAISAQ